MRAKSNIATKTLDELHAALVAAFLRYISDVAEPAPRLKSGFVIGDTARPVLSGLHFEMKVEFVLKLALDTPTEQK